MYNNCYSYSRFIIGYQVPMHLLLLLIIMVFRLIFIFFFWNDFHESYGLDTSSMYHDLFKAIIKGIRFDSVVVSYSLLIQIILSGIFSISKMKNFRSFLKVSKILFFIFTIIILLIINLDIPYYDYFGQHPGNEVFDWLMFGNTFGMAIQETSYYIYYLLFLVSLFIFILSGRFLNKFAFRSRFMYLFDNKYIRIISLTFILFLSLIGTRGQYSVSRISYNAAFFTDFQIVSQLTEGPVFHFADNALRKGEKLKLDSIMTPEQSVLSIYKQLYFSDSLNVQIDSISQIDTLLYPNHAYLENYNIILVFMESMTSNFLNRIEEGKIVTPFLDSLSHKSLFFNRFYSSGIHTNIGVGSTFTSFLPVLNHTMMPRKLRDFKSFIPALKEKGYKTQFFIPHHANYDNMELFLRHNQVDTIFSQLHYDPAARVSFFGVSDRYLYNFAVNELIKYDQQPFFASILTVGNHPPFIVPEEYKIFSSNEYSAAYFADQSLKEFLDEAEKQPWFDKTIFVFMADHGKVLDRDNYDVQLSQNHIPLLIYSPGNIEVKVVDEVGSQVDLIPTLMDLIGVEYKTDTYGRSLLDTSRPDYTAYCTATHLVSISKEYLYTLDPINLNEKLYLLADTTQTNIVDQKRDIANDMRDFVVARVLYSQEFYNNEIIP